MLAMTRSSLPEREREMSERDHRGEEEDSLLPHTAPAPGLQLDMNSAFSGMAISLGAMQVRTHSVPRSRRP